MNEKFKDVVKNFTHILVDNYGVVTFGGGLEPKALEVLKELKEAGKKVIFLSNATFTDPEERYAKKGLLKGVHYDAFITSGQYTSEYISRGTLPYGKKYYVFGTANFKKPEKVPAIFDGSPYELVEDMKDADFVYCGIPQINGEDRTDMSDFCSELLRLFAARLPMVCSNPDEIASENGRWVIRQGSVAKIYQMLGGEVVRYGKPDAAIFDYVLGDVPREQVLMVGDTLTTDILGANRAGVKSCLTINGGVTEMWMASRHLKIDDEGIRAFIDYESAGIPDYIVDKIF